MKPGTYGVVSFLGHELVFGRVDSLSLLFSYVFSLMAVLGMVFALHVEDDSQRGDHSCVETHRKGVAHAPRGLL